MAFYKIHFIKKLDEINQILDIFKDSLPSLSLGADFRAEMALKFSQNGNVICIFEDNNPIGFSAFYDNDLDSAVAYLSMIAVLPEYQGKQIGKMLLQETINFSKHNGMKWMKLEVSKENTDALHFYMINGFYQTDKTEKSFVLIKQI